MTSELISSKEHGKERITNAVFGLILALGSYALLFTINPDLLDTSLSSLKDVTIEVSVDANSAIVKPAGSASCIPAPTGPCSPSNLAIFGSQAQNASKICNVESGGNANRISGGDRCAGDNSVFSIGLFQINLVANGALVKDASGNSCAGLFEKQNGSSIDRSYIVKNQNGSISYDCKIKAGQETRLGSCSIALLNATENIRVAKALFDKNPKPFGAWYYSDKIVCGEDTFK